MASLRWERDEIVTELRKEWRRFGYPLRGDDFLEPEYVTQLAKTWMCTFAKVKGDGQIIMPDRVQHPGKAWIMEQAAILKGNFVANVEARQAAASKTLGQEKATLMVEGKTDQKKEAKMDQKPSSAEKTEESEFKIIYRDGGQRLVKLNFLGKRVADVPLPASTSNFKIIYQNGRFLLSSKGGADLYDCEEYVGILMPPTAGLGFGWVLLAG